MLVMMALLAANLPPIDAETEALRLECDIGPTTTKVGHEIDCRAAAGGGVQPYSWLWTVNGTPVASFQNITYTHITHTFNESGIYNVCVNVTDSLDNKRQCCTNVTVDEGLSLECWVSPNPTKVGHVTSFTAEASEGDPPYSWSWMVNGVPVATTQNTAHIFATAGDYTVCVNVTDFLGNKKQCCTPVTVNEALSLECEVSPEPTKVGHVTNFIAAASGGVPPYSWLWRVNGAPVATTQNTAHIFATGGSYTVCVNVTDFLGNKKQCCTPVTVNPALSLECEISPEPTKVGQVTNFYAAASGGVQPYSWLWTVNGAPVATTQNTVHTFAAGGTYTVCVNVTDSLDNKKQCCTPVTVNGDLYSLVLLPESDSNYVNTTHSLTATVYQGDNVMPDVNVTWSISGVGSFSGTPENPTDVDGQADAVITSSEPGISTVKCALVTNTSVFATATKTWTTAPPPTPGGGGGGGSCPTIKYLTVDWDGKITKKPLNTNNRLAVDLLGPSLDGSHSLLLEKGTLAPTVNGEQHYLILIRELEEIPPLPENTKAFVVINATPAGAVFDRDVFLTLGFDHLPENALSATIAYYNDVSGVWVPLETEQGGPPNSVAQLSLSAPINHFSIFGVLVEFAPTPTPPSPAHFVASGLSIVPSVEKIWESVTFVTRTGESVTITANVLNDGGQEGTYTVELKLNGETVDTEIMTLGAGQSQPVSFTVSGLDYGQYEVEVAGLSGDFTTSRTVTWWLIVVLIVVIGLISWAVVWERGRCGRAAEEGAAEE